MCLKYNVYLFETTFGAPSLHCTYGGRVMVALKPTILACFGLDRVTKQPRLLKIFNAEVMIYCEGFTQRSGTA